MSYELKVKSLALAAESRIIRNEERTLGRRRRQRSLRQQPVNRIDWARDSLYRHRLDVVRPEARATYLARGYLKGLPREKVEIGVPPYSISQRAAKIAAKYGRPFDADAFEAWIAG